MSADLIGVVEAGYSLDPSEHEWLRRVVLAANLDGGLGTLAFTFDTRRAPDAWIGRVYNFGSDPMMTGLVPEFYGRFPVDQRRELLGGARPISTGMREFGGAALDEFPLLSEEAVRFGFRDALVVCIADINGEGYLFGAPQPKIFRLTPAHIAVWKRLRLHLAAGFRLRRALLRNDPADAAAVLDSSGRVLDANGPARSRSARDALRGAVCAMERARGPLRRQNGRAALSLWQALVSGQWSLVDRFESDGRRFVIALENQPLLRDPRALSARERLVVHHAARGDSNKLIAYALGIAEGTVAALLVRALRKLGFRSRAELASHVAAWQAVEPSAELSVAGQTLQVASCSDSTRGALAERLTQRELKIARAIARGRTNAEIAEELCCSARTIANALARVFTRLGLRSRADLARYVA